MVETTTAPAASPVQPAPAVLGTVEQALGVTSLPDGTTTPAEPAKPEPVKPAEAVPAAPEPPAAFDMTQLTIPEGLSLDEKDHTEFSEAFAGLPKDQAQRLFDIGATRLKAAEEASSKAWADLNEKWVNEVKADPNIGGAKWDGTSVAIQRMLDVHGDPGLKEALALTGAGNNPAVIRTFAKLANLLTEGSHIAGAPAGPAKDLASIMYPTLPSKAL